MIFLNDKALSLSTYMAIFNYTKRVRISDKKILSYSRLETLSKLGSREKNRAQVC